MGYSCDALMAISIDTMHFDLILRQHLCFKHDGQIAEQWGVDLHNSPRITVTRPLGYVEQNGYLKFSLEVFGKL